MSVFMRDLIELLNIFSREQPHQTQNKRGDLVDIMGLALVPDQRNHVVKRIIEDQKNLEDLEE
jgi:hypothetical protein